MPWSGTGSWVTGHACYGAGEWWVTWVTGHKLWPTVSSESKDFDGRKTYRIYYFLLINSAKTYMVGFSELKNKCILFIYFLRHYTQWVFLTSWVECITQSTSFCSLSSWFTSSCAYHPITVTNFALTIYLSLSVTPDLKLISFTNPFLHSLLIPSGRPSPILSLYWTKQSKVYVDLYSAYTLTNL